MLTLEMRKAKESEIQSADGVAAEAFRFQSTAQKIMEQEAQGDTIPRYAEYLGERREATAALCLPDA